MDNLQREEVKTNELSAEGSVQKEEVVYNGKTQSSVNGDAPSVQASEVSEDELKDLFSEVTAFEGVDPESEVALSSDNEELESATLWAEKQMATRLLAAIPSSEWEMPMTMWIVKGNTNEQGLAALVGAALDTKVSWIDSNSTRAHTVESMKKLSGSVLIIKQQEGAKALTKLAFQARKFVLWLCQDEPSSFALANASGLVDVKDWRERTLMRLDALAQKDWVIKTEDGKFVRDWVESLDVISVEKAEVLAEEWNVMLSGLKSDGIVSSRFISRMNRIVHSVLVDGPDRVSGDPELMKDVPGLSKNLKSDLLKLVSRVKVEKRGRGVLLHGAPGTGKTMLAKIIAKESGRAYVWASYANWQACEHLGEHLKAIAESFNLAIAQAPSVMFIDELDSVSSREDGWARKNGGYMSAVINSLLEWVQLALESGVTVIGATNFPGQIDEALTRPGRLGEWYAVEYPEQEGRAEILASVLPEINAQQWSVRIGRASPAKLVEFAKEAKLLAQERGALQVSNEDLEAALRKEFDKVLAGRQIEKLQYAAALGLVAKARAMHLVWGSEGVSVKEACLQMGLEQFGFVQTQGQIPSGSAKEVWGRLHVALAPVAARVEAAREGINKNVNLSDALSSLADLDKQERFEVSECLKQLSSMGLAGQAGENGSMLWLNSDKVSAQFFENAWQSSLSDARMSLEYIKHAALLLVKEKTLSGDVLMEQLGLVSQSTSMVTYLH